MKSKTIMNEFLDIYRLYAKNFDRDYREKAWDTEDIEKLKKLLDKICGEIENGHIIIGILKNDLDIWQDLERIYVLQNVRDTVFEIETLLHSKDQKKKPDQLIEENVEERKKKEKELELERNEVGKWKKILAGEEPLKQYGTIGISPTIEDYIWNRLPTDFEHADVTAFFKEFYEEKLGRRLKGTSYGTYASRYIKYFKEHDPPIISWDERDYSKDIDKYKIVDKEPEKKEEKIDIQPKSESAWLPWEIQILKEHRPYHTAEYIHKNLLPHRTTKAITLKTGKLGIKKIREYEKKRKAESRTFELWRTWEDDVIREYHPYMAVEEYIGRLPGRTIDAVNTRASYLKVKKTTDTKQEKAKETKKLKEEQEKAKQQKKGDEAKKLLSEEHVGEKAEEIIEDELAKDKVGDGRRLTEGTKKLLMEEQEKAKQQKKGDEAKKLLSEEHVGEKAEEIIEDELAKDGGFFDEKIEETIEKPEKEEKRIEPETVKEHIDEKAEETIDPETVKPKINNPFHDGSAEHRLYQIAVESDWTAGFKKGTPWIMVMRRMAKFSKDEIKEAIDVLVKKRKAQRLPNNFIAFSE